jgi:hypothetical protein
MVKTKDMGNPSAVTGPRKQTHGLDYDLANSTAAILAVVGPD